MTELVVAAIIAALLAGGAVWAGVGIFSRDKAWPASALTMIATVVGLLALLRRRGRGGWRS